MSCYTVHTAFRSITAQMYTNNEKGGGLEGGNDGTAKIYGKR